MGLCLHCYGPIEAEKLSVLPDARYCVKCAHLLNGGSKKASTTNGNGNGRMTQLELPASSAVLTQAKAPKVVYYRRPAVLKEEVFDDNRLPQSTTMSRHRKRNKKKSEPSVWNYCNGGEAAIGDVVANGGDIHTYVVTDVDANMIECQMSGSTTGRRQRFYIRTMELLFRESEIPVNE